MFPIKLIIVTSNWISYTNNVFEIKLVFFTILWEINFVIRIVIIRIIDKIKSKLSFKNLPILFSSPYSNLYWKVITKSQITIDAGITIKLNNYNKNTIKQSSFVQS